MALRGDEVCERGVLGVARDRRRKDGSRCAAQPPGGHSELLQDENPQGVVEAVNGNIKALLRRGRGYRDLNHLLLKAQRLAATKTEFVAFRRAA